MTRKWLAVDDYLASEVVDSIHEIRQAQWKDAEDRGSGICSIELKTGWEGRAQRIILTINSGLQSERAMTLSREQTAALAPVLIFEARWALQEHLADFGPDRVRRYGLCRCPTCGLGPFANSTRAVSLKTGGRNGEI